MSSGRKSETGAEEKYRALADAYGADPARWPAHQQEAARAWIDRSAGTAQTWRDDAAQLDALLDLVEPVEPSPELLRRVAEIPLRAGARAPRGALGLAFWRWIALAAGTAALGLVAGIVVPERSAATDARAGSAHVGVSTVRSEEGEASWDELADLALASEFDEETWP